MSWMLGTVLENEVQDVAEAQPDRAIILMAQLTPPLQLYQDAAQLASNARLPSAR